MSGVCLLSVNATFTLALWVSVLPAFTNFSKWLQQVLPVYGMFRGLWVSLVPFCWFQQVPAVLGTFCRLSVSLVLFHNNPFYNTECSWKRISGAQHKALLTQLLQCQSRMQRLTLMCACVLICFRHQQGQGSFLTRCSTLPNVSTNCACGMRSWRCFLPWCWCPLVGSTGVCLLFTLWQKWLL